MNQTTIGVIGAGTMGAGIAQVAAMSGWTVLMKDETPEIAAKGGEAVLGRLDRLVEKGTLTADAKDEIANRTQSN